MDWEQVLKAQYQQNNIDDISDDELLDEAIALCESYFERMDKNKLLHHSRPLALAYLACKQAKRNK